jgi:uncharacterized protein YlxW (UPF0749 family)
MTDTPVAWRRWIRGIAPAFVCLLALTIVPAQAEAQASRQMPDLPPSVDQMKKEHAALAGQIEGLDEQLKAINESVGEVKRIRSAPPEAWEALRIVGFAFVVAWGLVSAFREWARIREHAAEVNRRAHAAALDQARSIEDAVDARMKLLVELLRDAQKQPGVAGNVADVLEQAAKLAASLAQAMTQGRAQKGHVP